MGLRNGQNAFDMYNLGAHLSDSQDRDPLTSECHPSMSTGKRNRTKTCQNGFIDSADIYIESEEDTDSFIAAGRKRRRLKKGRPSSLITNNSSRSSRASSRVTRLQVSRRIHDEDSVSDIDSQPTKKAIVISDNIRLARYRTLRNSSRVKTVRPISKLDNKISRLIESDDESDELGRHQQEFGKNGFRTEYRKLIKTPKLRQNYCDEASWATKPGEKIDNSSDSLFSEERPSRRSGRQKAIKRTIDDDEDFEETYVDDDSSNITAKVACVREIYQPVSQQDPFRLFHNYSCDVCSGIGSNSNKGTSPLIYCQGCSTSIHKVCLGNRTSREYLATKIGHENFVMQCRRCIGIAAKKDEMAPRLDICQTCGETGPSCAPFSDKKTPKQEERLREENEGKDPITVKSSNLINNSKNVLFRCTHCQRVSHFEHLPCLTKKSETPLDLDQLREYRLHEYASNWRCKDCHDTSNKVQSLVCWRPLDQDSYIFGQKADELSEDEKEYLIKWMGKSYFECSWMPGNWVWGVTKKVMRNAFLRRNEGINMLPMWTFQEAVPEEYLRIEIIFDVCYDDDFTTQSEKIDKLAIDMIDKALVKFQGLTNDDAAWIDPPKPEDTDRWSDFVAAYYEYVSGKYFKQSSVVNMKERIVAFRRLDFAKKVELKKQPSHLTGGKIMPYQLEGLNWLLYNFHQKINVILADEMGLGKTIQVISLFAALVKTNPKCWPFLVVTPNSTCPHWRREIKKWAPSLRVISYYGGKKAQEMTMKYEMYPENCSDLRAHVVVTSYEAPVDDNSKSWFRRIRWAGLVVDEGQRLKNDRNLLYIALKALEIPFRVLLTGTPLQNNKRELFNLLQFLDSSINAAELDKEFKELTKENLPQIHELIRPFFLRRTKLQVLNFLPPMAQVIVPVTMSVVQKKLYKSILAKNSDLIRSIFGQNKAILRPTERGNLNNILMQLRKCLCHPFLYSSAIEERSVSDMALYRNLVDASSKFQLLEIMLPKLRERGHRALIFSQFLGNLDLVEDFLTGLNLPFQRLDGNISSLEKQRRIDAFNAPDSPLFAFLLSTRAGGVGINLATADTVIIMDSDFNPHQDIQALSRAHRIGQKNKVLVFQLMTKDSAEEKIIQIGRSKMALDQVLIESLGAEDDTNIDLETILKFGAEALFNDDDRNDIHYDSASVDKLLDRSLIEKSKAEDGKPVDSKFSFARVWANDKSDLTEYDDAADSPSAAPNFSAWDKILKQREADAAAEAARSMQTFGRGKRSRQVTNYNRGSMELEDEALGSPLKSGTRRRQDGIASDLDFAEDAESPDEDSDIGCERVVEAIGPQPQIVCQNPLVFGPEIPCLELSNYPHILNGNSNSMVSEENPLPETLNRSSIPGPGPCFPAVLSNVVPQSYTHQFQIINFRQNPLYTFNHGQANSGYGQTNQNGPAALQIHPDQAVGPYQLMKDSLL